MKGDPIPKIPHDDGIFCFTQELAYGETSAVEYAGRVVAEHQERERRRLAKIELIVPDGIPLTKEQYRAELIDLVGKKGYSGPSLETPSTKSEHRKPAELIGFVEWPMPVYSDDGAMLRTHGEHCWNMALLNAFRIIDMTGDGSIPLPHSWKKIQIESGADNFANLLASAAYMMGRYHAMALAADSARAALRGREMLDARKGKLSSLGKVVHSACEQIRSEHSSFPARVLPKQVMTILEKQGLASMENSRGRVLMGEKWQDIDGKKLSAHIARFRKKLGR